MDRIKRVVRYLLRFFWKKLEEMPHLKRALVRILGLSPGLYYRVRRQIRGSGQSGHHLAIDALTPDGRQIYFELRKAMSAVRAKESRKK